MTDFEKLFLKLLVQIAIEIQRNSTCHFRGEFDQAISDVNLALRNNK